jgi:DNA-binding SARP family transcriptional activator
LGDLDDFALDAVSNEARERPDRWRVALRDGVSAPNPRTQLRAARLLEEVGSVQDIALLRSAARRLKRFQAGDLGRGLARRLAPRVYVQDLGRVAVFVGDRPLAGASIRRKALALVCYLLTTPTMSATRDQVLDALWPDQEPAMALNSLNQTIYFVRRSIEPEYDEDRSPGYLLHASDVVWLDAELVQSQSRECRELIRSAAGGADLSIAQTLTETYSGKFALDFAYEDWADACRESLHASFLEVVERTVQDAIRSGQFGDAIVVARRALEVDPSADQLEAGLLQLYGLIGAHAAAAEQYEHYASQLREGLGVEPPSLAEITAAPPRGIT